MAGNHQNDRDLWDRRADDAQRRARKLDQKIACTVATSTSGLLARLRLLSEFYDESTNGMGRRGALLIQTIAAGIERFEVGDPLGPSSASTAADHVYSTHLRSQRGTQFRRGRGAARARSLQSKATTSRMKQYLREFVELQSGLERRRHQSRSHYPDHTPKPER
jgi:hypothetical protein